VSLQTACLDDELLAQKGFQASEILMADSVALLRRKVNNVSLAIQDGTMNSVITLAAIEVSGDICYTLVLMLHLLHLLTDVLFSLGKVISKQVRFTSTESKDSSA
jgi:hypothetical protein